MSEALHSKGSTVAEVPLQDAGDPPSPRDYVSQKKADFVLQVNPYEICIPLEGNFHSPYRFFHYTPAVGVVTILESLVKDFASERTSFVESTLYVEPQFTFCTLIIMGVTR